jgi:transposase
MRPNQKVTPTVLLEIEKLYKQGTSCAEIGRRFKLGEKTVRRWLDKTPTVHHRVTRVKAVVVEPEIIGRQQPAEPRRFSWETGPL